MSASDMRPNSKSLIDFFSRSITAFQSSSDAYRVLCTLPHVTSAPAPRRAGAGLGEVVILDSSFNPPTRAHAEMARTAMAEGRAGLGKESLGKDGGKRLVLLLAVKNADKAPQEASFPVRLAMMEGFGRELGGDVDIAVTTMPFFHDKSRVIEESGVYGATAQTFLVGFDTLIRIFNPKYYDSLLQQSLTPFLERAKLRVTMRGKKEEQEGYMEGLEEWARGRVELVEGREGEGVSSSRVREEVRAGGDGEGLVGGEVRAWIAREGLYRDG